MIAQVGYICKGQYHIYTTSQFSHSEARNHHHHRRFRRFGRRQECYVINKSERESQAPDRVCQCAVRRILTQRLMSNYVYITSTHVDSALIDVRSTTNVPVPQGDTPGRPYHYR